MKKFYFLLAFLATTLFCTAQVNQLVWSNGRMLYGSPIASIDSLTFSELEEIDTLHLLLPKTLLKVVHDTIIMHDTIIAHDTIYINNEQPGIGNDDNNENNDNSENGTITSEPNYFYIASLENENTINLTNPNTWLGKKCTQMEYSLDRETWIRFKGSDIITLNTADTLFIRCRSGNICRTNNDNTDMFIASKKFNIGGDINTLIFDYKTIVDSLPSDYCMANLFKSMDVVDASQLILPATKLSKYCYYSMFHNCTHLTKAPELLANNVVEGCYAYMFYWCNNMQSGPSVLPAATLAKACYDHLFYNCPKLKRIKCLAIDKSASDCTYNWTQNISSSGVFIQSANATCWYINTGYNYSGIPSGWTIEVEYED